MARKKRAQRREKEIIPVCRTPGMMAWKSPGSDGAGREDTFEVDCVGVTTGVAGVVVTPGVVVPVTPGVVGVVTLGVVVAADRVV